MIKYLIVPPLLISLAVQSFAQVEPVAPDTLSKYTLIKQYVEPADETYAAYIDQFKSIAISEMYRTGIPASITLAQAVLESAGGTSELALQANNHFGIKCGANWAGKIHEKMDDDKDAGGNATKSCFRKYDKAEESFYDHSEFICDPGKSTRYSFLFKFDRTDYESWACGLESAGYAGDENYSDKLINLIERYSLFQYDLPGIQSPDSIQISGRVWQINGVKVVFSRANERLEDIARIFRLDVEKLAEYNDLGFSTGAPLHPNTRVFIEEKQKKWRGSLTYHVVQDGETIFDVSQRYGVRLSELFRRNSIKPGQEPAQGEQVRLRGRPLFSATNIRLRGAERGVNSSGIKQDTD